MTARIGALLLLLAGCGDDGPRPPPGSCGNGVIAIGELCDDGNTDPGDGCDVSCRTELGYTCTGEPSICRMELPPGDCSDGRVDPGEDCDEGGETAACDTDCTFVRCGDMVVNATAREDCDDGNSTNGDGCSASCEEEPATCGDRMCGAGETCSNCVSDCADDPLCFDCPDFDMDGFLDSACAVADGDCNDEDANVNPDGTEVPCNRIDEDCDPMTSDALDEDMDSSTCNFDCDDTDPARSPLFIELCDDDLDNDCDDRTPDILDFDGDGSMCDVDCNDYMDTVCPDCEEICLNTIDDDCDAATPDTDADLDTSCDAADCDDANPFRGVGAAFMEICGDLIDNDCDAATPDLEDADMDTFTCEIDCDDADRTIVPDAMGFCGTAIDTLEDFEADDGGWTTSGTASSWAWGRPMKMFIPAAAGGTNAWVTNLTGPYNNSEMSYLTSPPFDFSGIMQDPMLRFSHIFETESCCDEGWVEISTDGGTAWRKLGAAGDGTNWYNDTTNHWWDGTSGAAGVWRIAQLPLIGTAGLADVRIRFVFSTDSSITRAGFGVDNVQITNRLIDLAAVGAGIPQTTCSTASHPIAITVRNLGSAPVRRFTAGFSLDGAPEMTEMADITVLPGGTATYIFSRTINLSTLGAHSIQVRATATGDAVAANDTLTRPIMVDGAPFIVLGTGYTEGFESGAAGWTASGTASTWEVGRPRGPFITDAATGMGAWEQNLTGPYNSNETSFLLSPCFDLRATSPDPILSFSHIFETESCCDEGWVEIATPLTGGFVKLGAAGSGTNWYNDATNRWWEGTSGMPGAWRTASHPLTGSAGQPVVRLRFAFSSDSSVTAAGFGVDNLSIMP